MIGIPLILYPYSKKSGMIERYVGMPVKRLVADQFVESRLPLGTIYGMAR